MKQVFRQDGGSVLRLFTPHSSSRSDSLPSDGNANIYERVVNLFRTTKLFLFVVTVPLTLRVACPPATNPAARLQRPRGAIFARSLLARFCDPSDSNQETRHE